MGLVVNRKKAQALGIFDDEGRLIAQVTVAERNKFKSCKLYVEALKGFRIKRIDEPNALVSNCLLNAEAVEDTI